MSFSVGFPNAGAITIGGKTPSTINALSEATEEASTQLTGKEENQVRTGGAVQGESKSGSKSESKSTQSIAVQVLLKRMQELQQQLREQQQQLAATQATKFANEEAKATAVMAVQQRIADTAGAIAQVAGALAKALTEGSTTGSMVSTSV